MAFCSNCGAQIGEGDPFCGKCGAKVVQAVPPQVSSPVIGTSGLATAALVLGILGFPFVLLSIGAIICGILGIKETGVGGKRGRSMAIAGLVLGCVALVGWVTSILIRAYVWKW